jgi:hypothetical protein
VSTAIAEKEPLMSPQITATEEVEMVLPPRRPAERRRHRRYEMETRDIVVEQWEGARRQGMKIGKLVDISAGGMRLRTRHRSIRPDAQIRVRLTLPDYAGICPFIDTRSDQPRPTREWVGWLAVNRVERIDQQEIDIAGRLLEMDELDQAMLKLYLSTQPLAA